MAAGDGSRNGNGNGRTLGLAGQRLAGHAQGPLALALGDCRDTYSDTYRNTHAEAVPHAPATLGIEGLLAHRAAQLVRHMARAINVSIGQYQRELIAADPGRQIDVLAHARALLMPMT